MSTASLPATGFPACPCNAVLSPHQGKQSGCKTFHPRKLFVTDFKRRMLTFGLILICRCKRRKSICSNEVHRDFAIVNPHDRYSAAGFIMPFKEILERLGIYATTNFYFVCYLTTRGPCGLFMSFTNTADMTIIKSIFNDHVGSCSTCLHDAHGSFYVAAKDSDSKDVGQRVEHMEQVCTIFILHLGMEREVEENGGNSRARDTKNVVCTYHNNSNHQISKSLYTAELLSFNS